MSTARLLVISSPVSLALPCSWLPPAGGFLLPNAYLRPATPQPALRAPSSSLLTGLRGLRSSRVFPGAQGGKYQQQAVKEGFLERKKKKKSHYLKWDQTLFVWCKCQCQDFILRRHEKINNAIKKPGCSSLRNTVAMLLQSWKNAYMRPTPLFFYGPPFFFYDIVRIALWDGI